MTYQVLKPHYRVEECLEEIKECLVAGWTGEGFKTIEFEDAWKNYTGLPNAYFVNSATSGLHLAVRVLKDAFGWRDGDEIITTPFTFVSTNHAILYENLFPVFADVDNTLTLDPEKVEELIKKTRRARAIMFVGVGGNVGNLEQIKKLCNGYNLKLILDASHMSGTKWLDGKHVGMESDVAIFSFHSVKNLPTADGGMVCFGREDFDSQARKLSWLGINKNTFSRSKGSYKWEYDVEDVGFKYHGNSVMASLGLVGLRHLDYDNEYRRELSDIYSDYFDEFTEEDLHDPINSTLGTMKILYISHYNCISSRHLYQIVVDDRDSLLNELYKKEIYPGVHYVSNTKYHMYSHGYCPVSEWLSDRVLSLPLHLELTRDDVKYIAETIMELI